MNSLDEICDFYKGNGLSKSHLSDKGEPCILYGELYTTYKKEIIDSVVSKTNIELSNPFKSQKNDVIIPGSGEDPIDIAVARAIEHNGIVLGGDLNVLRPHSNYSGAFMSYQLNGRRRFEIAKKAQGKSIVHLHNSDLKEIKVYMPQYDEQIKVTEFLKLIDQRIELQNKIIEDLKLLKDSIIDYLYNHNGGLEYKFKDLYTKAKEGGTPSTTVTSYYKNGQIPFIKIDDLNSKYIIHNQTYITNEGMKNSSAWLIPKNSVILSNGATIGVTSINTYPVTTKQGILGIIPSKLVNYEYLYYLLNTSVFKKNLKKITTKGTMECAYIKDIDNIILRIPSLDVQLKSVKTLNSLDQRLAVENNLINEYKNQKIYLLRNLFI